MAGFRAAHRGQLIRALAVAATAGDGLSVEELARLLYGGWYAAPRPVDPAASWPPAGLDPRSPGSGLALPAVLRAGHPGEGAWEPATVVSTGLAGVLVVRPASGGVRAVARGDHAPALTAALGCAPAVGAEVLVRRRLGGLVEGGWWRTWGTRWSSSRMPHQLTRLYLGARPEAIQRLVPTVLDLVAGLDAPWLVKVGAQAPMLARPDGVVVYLPDAVAGLVDGIPDPLVRRLLAATEGLVAGAGPALTEPLADGVAWTQDPGDGLSYGEHVCRLVATALTAPDLPRPLGSTGADEQASAAVAAIGRVFRSHGLDPAAPHLCRRRKDAA